MKQKITGQTWFLSSKRVYGNACLKAMEFIDGQKEKPDVVVYLDGDHSDYPEQMNELVQPIVNDEADLVVGSRVLGRSERGQFDTTTDFW